MYPSTKSRHYSYILVVESTPEMWGGRSVEWCLKEFAKVVLQVSELLTRLVSYLAVTKISTDENNQLCY